MNDAPAPPPDLIEISRAADVLAVSKCTVYRLVKDGRLRAWKRPGKPLRVSKAQVLALLVPVQVRRPP